MFASFVEVCKVTFQTKSGLPVNHDSVPQAGEEVVFVSLQKQPFASYL